MIQLKRCLIATAGLVMLVTAVARLNALNAVGMSPHGSVHALFDLSAPVTGPFPSDWFTVADTSHNTGRRISLPLPDCETRRSDCEDIAVLNSLDGFNLQPRLSVPFSGSIDANSVTSDTVFLVSLGSTLPDQGTCRRAPWSASTRSSGTRSPPRCTSSRTRCWRSTRALP